MMFWYRCLFSIHIAIGAFCTLGPSANKGSIIAGMIALGCGTLGWICTTIGGDV